MEKNKVHTATTKQQTETRVTTAEYNLPKQNFRRKHDLYSM